MNSQHGEDAENENDKDEKCKKEKISAMTDKVPKELDVENSMDRTGEQRGQTRQRGKGGVVWKERGRTKRPRERRRAAPGWRK